MMYPYFPYSTWPFPMAMLDDQRIVVGIVWICFQKPCQNVIIASHCWIPADAANPITDHPTIAKHGF